MRVELGRLDPDVAVELRRRAYTWHREHGNTVGGNRVRDRCRHVRRGERHDRHVLDPLDQRRDVRARSWPGYIDFPRTLARRDVRLQLVQGWAESLSRREREATATIGLIEELLSPADAVPLPDGFSSAAWRVLPPCRPSSRGGTSTWATRRRDAQSSSRGPTSPWRPVVCWAMGLNLLFRGELAEADTWFVEATSLAPAGEQWLVACNRSTPTAPLSPASARTPRPQARLAGRATAMAREHGLEDAAAGPSHRRRVPPWQTQGPTGEALARCSSTPSPWPASADSLGCSPLRWASYASVLCELGEHDRAKAALA